MEKLSLEQGIKAVRYGRSCLKEFFGTGSKVSADEHFFELERGVFSTLRENGELKGCIGFPLPEYSLKEGIDISVVHAASKDPRFPGLDSSDVENVCLELSVLTKPTDVEFNSLDELVSSVDVGRHGLIVSSGFKTGLLLPQVAVDNSWSAEEFLSAVCTKAGLDEDAWRERTLTFKTFEAQVFEERSPGGDVVEK